MYDYEEACPVSKASSILGERWTLQIIRELMFGACRFNELQAYLPRMSPTLLNTRLKALEKQGIVLKTKIPEKKGFEYQLSPMGESLKPVILELGKWGMHYAFENIDPAQLNAVTLIRDFAVSINHKALPKGPATLQFNVEQIDGTVKRFVVIQNNETSICDENIGTEVTLYLTASLATFGDLWYGKTTLDKAVSRGELKVIGDAWYANNISKWLGISQFAGK